MAKLRKVLAGGFGVLGVAGVLLLSWGGSRSTAQAGAPQGSLPLVPTAEPPQHVPMDHADPGHHHHAHKADHKGNEHSPAGLGDHHHHHHAHPHAPDPHHHHPH